MDANIFTPLERTMKALSLGRELAGEVQAGELRLLMLMNMAEECKGFLSADSRQAWHLSLLAGPVFSPATLGCWATELFKILSCSIYDLHTKFCTVLKQAGK